jgi:hypothetical protein
MEPAMLDLNPETVYFIIDKAREFQIGDEVNMPEEIVDVQDWNRDTFAPYLGDPAFVELKSTIEDLEPDQQISLVALMWVGRGDYSPDEWDKVLATAAENWNERTAEYLIGTPLLADFLEEGLDSLGIGEEEAED